MLKLLLTPRLLDDPAILSKNTEVEGVDDVGGYDKRRTRSRWGQLPKKEQNIVPQAEGFSFCEPTALSAAVHVFLMA